MGFKSLFIRTDKYCFDNYPHLDQRVLFWIGSDRVQPAVRTEKLGLNPATAKLKTEIGVELGIKGPQMGLSVRQFLIKKNKIKI